MTTLPKPTPRPKAGRKRILSVRAKGKRKKVTRREERKRLFKDCCDLWAFIVKARVDYRCESTRPHECTRVMQAAHGFPKKAHPATRFELWNGLCLCSGEHTYYTYREGLWFYVLASRWGLELYRERMLQASTTVKLGLDAVRDKLEEQVALLGLSREADERGLLRAIGIKGGAE